MEDLLLTKRVTSSEFPNASDKLSRSSVSDGETDDQFRVLDSTSGDVEHRQHPSGGRETEQTQWSRVGKLAVVDGEGRLRGVLNVSAWSDGALDGDSVVRDGLLGVVFVGHLVLECD